MTDIHRLVNAFRFYTSFPGPCTELDVILSFIEEFSSSVAPLEPEITLIKIDHLVSLFYQLQYLSRNPVHPLEALQKLLVEADQIGLATAATRIVDFYRSIASFSNDLVFRLYQASQQPLLTEADIATLKRHLNDIYLFVANMTEIKILELEFKCATACHIIDQLLPEQDQ